MNGDGPDLLNDPPPKSRKAQAKAKPRKDRFVKLPYPEALGWPTKLGPAGMIVLLHLLYESWKDGSPVVTARSKDMRDVGISRYVKLRGLRRLRSIGWVKDKDAKPGRHPVVRLTLPKVRPRK
jgi:hypothetical protein